MQKKCFITVRDEVFCHITGLQPSDNDFLWNKLAPFVDGYFFMPAYKLGRFDGKIRFFEKTGKTYVRLLEQILPYLDKWGYDIELVDNRPAYAQPTPKINTDHLIPLGIQSRSYQIDAVNKLITAGSGFCIAGTGAGKSIICALLCDAYGKLGYKTITIVPSSDLVTQTADWYKVSGMDCGEYSGDKKELDHLHVVATWQSLQNNPQLMSFFKVVIVDEAHGAKAAVVQKLINEAGKDIPFRFGVTGTFPKGEADQLSLKAAIGEVLIEITARWLIDNGYLAEIEIEPVVIQENVDEDFPDYKAERAFVSKSEPRMDLIADLIIDKCERYGNTLVLVNSVDFGEKLAGMIKDSVFLYGESKKETRKEHYDAFGDRNDMIVIATAGIASTGISIDRVFCLMMIDAGKSFIRAIQSVGRGTRLAHDKNKVHVVDVHSALKWSKKHHKERIKYFKEAQYPISPAVKLKLK